MPGPVFLEGDAVELRTVEEEDLDDLQRWINDPRIRAGIGLPTPVDGRQQREWWESDDDGGVSLLACVDGEAVGSIGFVDLNEADGIAELGHFYDPDAWGKGYATDAARTLCRYAFDERRLEKVHARVFETNPASTRVLEKVGFVEEGRFRDHRFVDGERVDEIRYGLLAGEFG